MADLKQVPGVLNITTARGDDLPSTLLDFSINLTGYTFDAKIIPSNAPETPITITVTNTDLANGQITLSASDSDLEDLSNGSHQWRLVWTTGAISRRILAGSFTVIMGYS